LNAAASASPCDDSLASLAALRALVREGESIFVLQVPAIRIPNGLIAARTAQGVQMLATRPIAPQAGAHTIVESVVPMCRKWSPWRI
jgi:hypothetical protein